MGGKNRRLVFYSNFSHYFYKSTFKKQQWIILNQLSWKDINIYKITRQEGILSSINDGQDIHIATADGPYSGRK